MKTLIIYTSQTGFTKKYSEWLADEMEADILDDDNYDSIDDEEDFMDDDLSDLSIVDEDDLDKDE